jgi:hypothetical protein
MFRSKNNVKIGIQQKERIREPGRSKIPTHFIPNARYEDSYVRKYKSFVCQFGKAFNSGSVV